MAKLKIDQYQVVKKMLDATGKTLTVKQKGNAQQLKEAAVDFLEGVNAVIYANQNILNKQLSKRHSLKDIYLLMRDSTKITQHSIGLQYLFEMNLNKFLGREIFLLYITEKGEMIYADEIAASNIYQLANKNQDEKGRATGRGGGINIGQRRLQYLRTYPPNIVIRHQDMLKEREEKFQEIRDEVLRRWTINHSQKNGWVKRNPKILNTFYWQIGVKNNGKKKYDWSDQINRGHIYETYASLIWQSKEEMNLNKEEEADIGRYWDWMKAHNLNNISGIVAGDISFYKDTNVQFAVKSGSFNTAAMGTYLDVAFQLTNQDFEITEDNVKDLLTNLKDYQNAVLEYGLHESKQIIDQQLIIK